MPAPLVWGLALSMVSVGLLAASGVFLADEEDEGDLASMVAEVDMSTPERAAETFLDAWRKRDHRAALAASQGGARERVAARQLRDRQLSGPERALKEQVWDTMAAARLALMINESEDLDGGVISLRGTAEGEFLSERYVREVRFAVAPDGHRWLVEEFEFGEILEGAELTRELP
jgi:hypothetical protein